MWPFNKPEARQAGDYTDLLTAAIEANATGGLAGDATAAIESAAGAVSRAFASAEVAGTDLVTSDVLAAIGRNLIRHGESLHLITVDQAGRVALRPVGSWSIQGGADPADWFYRCDIHGPSGSTTILAPGASVVHCKYSIDPARPWIGVGPLTRARLTAKLAGAVELALADEAGGARGNLLPIPAAGTTGDAADDFLARLKGQLAGLRGKTLVLETTAGAFGDGRDSAPRRDWKAERLGAAPPASLISLDESAAQQILGACGVPASLVQANADGTAQREAFRRFVGLTIEPLARLVEAELGLKLSAPVKLGFTRLHSSDLAGRARAFQSMVVAGMPAPAAATLSGLLVEESDDR